MHQKAILVTCRFSDIHGRLRRAEDAYRSIARFERREHGLKMRLVHDLARRSADDAESNLKVFRATLTRTLPVKVGKK